MRPEYDMVVCGGAVAGLTMAGLAAQQGVRVVVLEKQATDRPVHRGELLQPRSLEIFAETGVLDRLRESGAVSVRKILCRSATGENLGLLDYTRLSGSCNTMLAHYYHGITAVLERWAVESGAEIIRGSRVEDLLRDDAGRVVGVRTAGQPAEEIGAALVVGADGRASTVRTRAGIEYDSHQYPHQMVAFDVTDPPEWGPYATAILTRDGMRLFYPMPGNRARLYVQVPLGQMPSIRQRGIQVWLGELLDELPVLRRLCPDAARIGNPQPLSAWRSTARDWVAPGLVLIGDSAHAVHPMAGQGMNAAIADAWRLGQCLRAAPGWAGDGGVLDGALHRYEHERRREVDYVTRLSNSMAMAFTDTRPARRLVSMWMLRRNRANLRLQHVLTYNMSGLGVHRFTALDRAHQFGLLPDPRAAITPALG